MFIDGETSFFIDKTYAGTLRLFKQFKSEKIKKTSKIEFVMYDVDKDKRTASGEVSFESQTYWKTKEFCDKSRDHCFTVNEILWHDEFDTY